MKIGEIERIGEREIPMPAFVHGAVPAPSRPPANIVRRAEVVPLSKREPKKPKAARRPINLRREPSFFVTEQATPCVDARFRHDIIWRGCRACLRRRVLVRPRRMAAVRGVSKATQTFSPLATARALQ